MVRKARLFTRHVVVVDGYSKDDTAEMALKTGADVIFQEGRGKGMALRTAFSQIESDVYVIIDGDATYDAREMEVLVQPILDGEADMVVGSRLRGWMGDGAITGLNKVGNNVFNWLINLFYRGAITDSQSGFRALNRKAVESISLSSDGFEVETELTIKALKQGLREVPITYRKRRGSPLKLNSFRAGSNILKTARATQTRSKNT